MDFEKQFLYIIQSILTQNADEVENAGQIFNQMILQDPEELVSIHLKILSSTDDDSVRRLVLIFLGRFFCLIKSNQIDLSSEISEFIQNSLFSLFQNENFTNNFDYLAYDIYKCADYYQEKWPQLPELLFELIISNSDFSSSALNCLSDCISSRCIDIDSYFDLFYNYIGETLLSTPESNLSKISSLLRLVYSLAKSKNYQPKEIFIPLFDQIPNYLEYSFNCEDSCRIINDFLTNVQFNPEIFENSYRKYFETFTKMISNPCYETIRNTSVLILSRLISAFSINFHEESIAIFDFYIENFNEETHELFSNSFYELSNLYGEDHEFAFHIFEYLQNNSPSQAAFICFASSFNGIKCHFSDLNLVKNLIEILSSGFQSDDEIRKSSFLCFRYVIKDLPVDNSNLPIFEIFDALKSAIQKENDEETFLREIQLLEVLLKKFSDQIEPIVGEIIEMVDFLLVSIDQIDSQIELFQCYKIISMKLREEFLPYSQNFVLKIIEVLKNPKQCEKLFFSLIEMIPLMKFSIDEENLNELLSLSFNYLFSEVYDEFGNAIDCNDYQSCIINFFLNCLENDTMCDSMEVIEKVAKISFQNSSFSIEKVDKNADLSFYFGCQLFHDSDEKTFNIVSNDEIERVQNSLKILNELFQNQKELFGHFDDERKRLVVEIFDYLFIFKNNSLSNDTFLVDKLILPFLTIKEEFNHILNVNCELLLRKSSEIDLNQFIAFLADYLNSLDFVFNDNFDDVLNIVGVLYQISTELFNLSYLQFASRISDANFIEDEIFYTNLLENTQINSALFLRELFKKFPSIGPKFFPFKTDILCLWPLTIVFSDFVNYCVNDNDAKRGFIESFLKMRDEKQNIKLNSMYALSIISNPQCLEYDSMHDLLKNFLNNFNEINNDIKNWTVFILLQVFQNYSSLFDFSVFFWDLFDSDSCLVPDFCVDYFARSLIFFVSNFSDSIPGEKICDIINTIQKLLGKKLDRKTNEEIIFLLETLHG